MRSFFRPQPASPTKPLPSSIIVPGSGTGLAGKSLIETVDFVRYVLKSYGADSMA